MAFDIDGARREGYSNAEIADHLARTRSFDVRGARAEGYSDADIINHLTKGSAPAAKPPAPAATATPETPPALPPGAVETPGGAVMALQQSGRSANFQPKRAAPVAPELTATPAEQPRYRNRIEALDDAVNLLEEGEPQDKVVQAFAKTGISWNDIIRHGQGRRSEYFRRQPAQRPAQPPAEVTAAAPSGEMRAWEPSTVGSIANTFKRAKANFGDMATSLFLNTGGIDPDQAALRFQRYARDRATAAPSEEIQNGMQAIGQSQSFGDAAQAMFNNPRATFTMLVDSVLSSTPALAATVGATLINPFAGIATAASTSAAMEYSSAMADVLQEKGINLTDAERVSRALRNPEILREIKEKGAKRGLIVGAFDGLSMGLAGRFLRPANELISAGKLSGSAAKRATVAAWSKELATQAGLGAAGEAAAQKATGEFKPADILLEAAAEGITAPIDAVSNLRQAAALDPMRQLAAEIDGSARGREFTQKSIQQDAIDAMSGRAPASIADIAGAIPAGTATVPAAPAAPAAEKPEAPVAQAPGAQPPVPQGQQSVEDLVPTIPGMPGEEEVSQLPGEEGVAPVTPSAPSLAERIGPILGPSREDDRNEEISLEDASLLRKMVVKTVDDGLAQGKTRQQIIQKIEALTKGGISNAGLSRIHDYLTERGVKEEPAVQSGETSVTPVTLTGEQPEERRMPPSVLGAFDLPNGMEVRVFKTDDGFGTGLFDVDSQNYVNGSITRFRGDDALPKAMGKASEMASQAMPGAPTPTGQVPAPTGQTTPTPKPGETTAPEAEPDKPAPGFVRVYHSGSAGEGDSGRWASTDRRYASDYRPDLPLFYLDIPSSDPRVNNPDYPEQGLGQGFTFNFELRPEEASQLKEIPRATTAKTTPPAPPIEGFVLQNRDRSSEASRNQMQSIAKEPDYERVSFSKTPSGAPIVAMGSIPENQLGRTGTVTTSSGRKIPVQYGVVEAGDIIASNDIDGNVDKRYGDSKVPGLRAIAGNGRTVGLREAYRRGTAGGYRQAMMEDELHGIDPNVIAGMQNPVLVRLMPQESLTPTIGDELNRTDMLELSPVEQAKTDLSRVDLESLSFDDEGGITPSAIAQFINAMPIEERGTLTDRGMPTKQAYQRLENAIFAQAYEDDALIALFAQAQDPEARLVISALMQAAPSMARLKDAGNLDIRGIVTDAARMIISGKRRGLKLSEIAAQADLTTDPDALIIVKLFADNPRSNKQVVEALINAANIAYQESIKPAEGLFGPTDTISRRDLINRIGGGSGQTTVAGSKGTGAAPSDAKGETKPGSAGVSTTGEELPTGEEAPEVISGEQGKGTGASDQEVEDVGESFDLAASREEITKIFTPPAKNERIQIEKKTKVYVSGQGYMTIEEAKKRIQEWKINAAKQGEGTENSDKVVLSLFDLTGEWSRPWEEAGYQVYRFDIQADKEVGDVNNFSTEFFNDLFSSFEGADVYAILAACPCTDFASSGSRWFGAKDASGETTSSVALVQKTLATIEYFKPAVWAIENPVGRIEKLTGLPPWRVSFDPNHFGDPYTKKTLLWGRFNGDMPIAPVEPTEGSKMHKKYGGKSQKTKNARSVTPEGFAYAFFQANNAIDNPLMAISNKYDMMDRDVLKKALDAGMTPEDISSAIDDPYYMDQDWDAAKEALLDRIKEKPVVDKQIKDEANFIEEDTKKKLEAIADGFMVGDLVRFGNNSGVVVGVEGDYVRFRPDSARSPKAYQRVPNSSLTFVSRPDSSGTVSYSKDQDKKFGAEAGQLNADMGNLIQLLGANMYQSSLSDVSIKELLQNAFDAVKGATASVNAEGKKITPLYKSGSIEIYIDRDSREIRISDNARGMTPDIVRKAFFTVAGSDKSDLPPNMRSGGLGLAKMGFMLGSERLMLDTVRDGVRVTVDTTARDIANNKFTINKSPAPKSEHGTTVIVKIPETYLDPKTGEEKNIYFPYSLGSIDPLNKPLVGPVEIKATLNSFGQEETVVLPVGVNFPEDNYVKFKANFEWGSADIYFSINRNNGKNWEINHQVLSSGVYQFSPDFSLNNEKIPYDIIVDVKPNVDARHPDYPFENSRERFKGRLKKDIDALSLYLGQISRGYEARDLQESFKDLVSMPRMEAGEDIAGISEKLKKTFGTQAAQKPAELKPLPEEVTITQDAVEDTRTKKLLVDVKAKEAEKQKESTFKGEGAPKTLDFMIEMKQDPKLPVFHNNTNVDFLSIGRSYGEPEKFFAELGTLLVEMKEEMANSGIYGYEKLSPENLFFAGISIDKDYGGVHIKVPYKAVFLNPFYDFGARTLFGARETMLNTMIHEIAHTGSMDHGVAHNSNMVKVAQYLSDEGLLDYYRDAILDILRRHESTFTAMREAYGKATTRNTAKSLDDYAKDTSAASARSDLGGREYEVGAVPSGEGRGRGAGVQKAEAPGREGEVGGRTGEAGSLSLLNVAQGPSNVDLASRGQTADGVRTPEQRREDMINEYKSLRQRIAAFPRRYAREKLKSYSDRPENIKALLERAAELRAAIESTKPTRDTPEDFLARAAKALADGEISQETFDVIDAAFRQQPALLDGLRLSVRGERRGVLGSFSPLQRIVALFGMGGYDPATIRHELAHSLEQMMLPEQKKAVFNAWVKALSRAMKQYTDDQSKAYFQAVIDFISNPSNKTLQAAVAQLPSYEMYQFINPSEYWAVNAESLMEAQLGSSWQRFKMAVRRLFEGLKKVFGFDNKYDVHKTFANVMKGSKERISRNVLVDYVTGLGGRLTTLENVQPDRDLLEKHNRPHTPMPSDGSVKGYLMNSYKAGKEFFKEAAQDPKQAIVGTGDFVIDGLVAARSKSVWYGAGVEARDFDRYGGQLGTSNGMATASLALDNAIRGGNIGVEVIFKGGIKYDPKSKNIVATNRDKGMRGVYEAEAKLRSKIGDQLATDIIQGYLEAKRSISIMNELYDREQEYESAKQALDDLKKIGADPDDIRAAQSEHDQLLRDLQAIKKAVSSVNMSEDEMREFASWDQRHPELRDIMENWTAINQNLLRFWRQVGLLSQKRYETLSNIKDYVPWYRIMSDEEDIHSDLQSGTRALTNIGLEKKFKRGRPVAVVDFRAKAGQKEFKIQPSSVVSIEINGKRLSAADMNNLVSVTPGGDVKIDMNLAENDLVVFRTNREIQNIIDNMTTNVMRMTMNGIRQYAANRIVSEYASRDADNKIMTFSGTDKEKGRFNWVTNGKKVVVEIRDPLVAASIYGMDTIGLKMWEPLAAVANLTRRSITLSMAFQVKQVFKDAPTAAFVTGVRNPFALIGGVWKGFLTSLTNTDPVVELLKEAGIGGFHSPARTPEAEIKRRLGIMNRNVFDFVIKGLDHIGDSSDMAQRVAVYKRVLAETGDEAQAMFQAANVINFLHHGSMGAAQFVVKTVPFFGAWANSTDVLVRALVGGGLKGMGRAKALQRLAFTGLLLSSVTILYCMLAGADPEYEELDDQTRLRNIIIPGTKIMLPMNTTAAYIFKAIPEMLYNKIMREGTDSAIDRRRLRSALADAALDAVIGPEPIPAGIKPVFEVAINRSFFTERSIIPEALRNVEAAQQYTASTSEIGKMISGLLTIPGTDGKRVISPIEADHLLRGVLGSAGAMAQWASNSIGAIAEVRPEPSARERPVVGGFLRDEVPRGLESLYYDFKKDVNQKYQTYQTLVNRENLDAAEAYLEKHGDIVAMQKYINKTDSQLGEINREIRRIGETVEKDLTPRERRLEINDLRRLRLELLEPVRELRQEVYGTETGIERVLKRLRQSQ